MAVSTASHPGTIAPAATAAVRATGSLPENYENVIELKNFIEAGTVRPASGR